MKNKNYWLALVILLLGWSIYELNPPTSRNLLTEFVNQANQPDAAFSNIVAQARQLEARLPGRTYGNLYEAIGTNRVVQYFPFGSMTNEVDPTAAVLRRLQREAAGQIKLGLDLQGGTSFLVAMDTNALAEVQAKDRALAKAVEVLRKRVDKFGVAEPIIQPVGESKILIQLPGLTEQEKEQAKISIQRAAFLEFRLVHKESDQKLAEGIIPVGYTNMVEKIKNKDGVTRLQPLLVKRAPERGLTGKYIKSASVIPDQITGRPEISFTLNSEGAAIFSEITQQNVGNRLAIILDGELQSAPVIRTEIMGGSGVIQGDFTVEQAYELANVLLNPLEAPVKIEEEREVKASLGVDSIRSGVKASLIGVIAVSGFMLVYYLFGGLVANFALMLNIVILMGVMCSFDTTLTLPGIAGIVLTIGMAVDANVLIFERIREELAEGKSLRGALSAGYDKAFGTILDSNLTTLISSVILIFMGTGPVKGFGVTLTIGVSVSMFTALVVTRLIFDFLLDRGWLKSLRMFSLIHGTKVDFIRWAKPAFATSWTLILIGCAYGVYRGHDVLGVDFAGGDKLTLRYDASQKLDLQRVRQVVGAAGVKEFFPQEQRDLASGIKSLEVTSPFGTSSNVVSALLEAMPEMKFEQVQKDTVGPSVGQEIQKTAVIAALVAMFGILVYVAFRYEFSFAVGAVIAILHDILMTMGWFFLSGRELSAPIVAAVLTIIGFSINDTIVIFDRIREDLKLGVRGTFREIMNHALNRTLSRTIITSGTVFLATLSLYLFGGGVINDFAFTFLVGIVTGTYSSIYIASALVLWWHKGERPQIGAQVVVQNAESARA
jgi:SecD/SecF fusion protein